MSPDEHPPRSSAIVAPPPWTRADVIVLAVVLGIATALVWPTLFRGWETLDDGAMAQVAERVLRGQLPHRDFDDPWTGGWSFVQAGFFHLFGASLRMLRIPIFATWMGSLACGFRLARRFTAVGVAGVVALASAVWSLYAFHYPLLNWYYAPLALFAVWAVTRYVESGRTRYVVIAGVMVGIAITFKISGLYLLAAFLLWCAAHVSHVARSAQRGDACPRAWGYAVLVTAAGALLAVLVLQLVLKLPTDIQGSAMFLFVLPVAATACWLSWSAYGAGTATGPGLRVFVALLVPFALGIAVPLIPFLALYAGQGALGDLYHGVFVRPAMRFSIPWFGSSPPGRVTTGGMMLAPLILVVGVRYATSVRGRMVAALAVILGVVAGLLAEHDQFTASSTTLMVRGLPVMLPLVALWGSCRGEEEPGPYGSIVFLLVACAVTAQLLQIPAPYLNYVIYVTPITILALVALLVHRRAAVSTPVILFAAVFLVVAGVRHPVRRPNEAGVDRWARLDLPRGGLWVSPQDSAMYQRIAMLVSELPAGPIHVVGDAPEYAFLLERASASRVIYDPLADSAAKDPRLVLPMLARAGVQVVVIRYSVWDDSLVMRQKQALRREFPRSRQFGSFVYDGRTFSRTVEVRWRTDTLR